MDSRSNGNPELNGPVWHSPDRAAFLASLAIGRHLAYSGSCSAAVRLGTGEAKSWAEAAGDAFYDQAHFIREFRTFTGKTPARFLVETAPITRITLTRRRLVPGLPKLTMLA